MDILRNLRQLESRLARTVDDAAQKMAPARPRDPLEILHAIVDEVGQRIEPAGRGKYVFPFNRIRIAIPAGSHETQARFEAVFGSEPSLRDRIADKLQISGCAVTGLITDLTYVGRSEALPQAADFSLEFERVTPLAPVPVQGPVRHRLKLTVVQGETEMPAYVFTTSCVNLGRCPEVRDSRNRLMRTNHVAFTEDGGEPNPTVSRNHAHIDCTANPGEYRLYDDRSAHGTSLVRDGKTIAVPAGARGVRLQSGDAIILGEACLGVEIAAAAESRARAAEDETAQCAFVVKDVKPL